MACRAEPLEPSQRPRRERVAAFRLGFSAESRAAMFLIAKGYRIVAAAKLWPAHHPDENERDIRFDVMLVAPGRLPQHIANAFDASR
jgi:putative endonuclease